MLRLRAEICWIQSFYRASKVCFFSLIIIIFSIVCMCGEKQVAVLTSVALHTTPLPIIMLAVCIMACYAGCLHYGLNLLRCINHNSCVCTDL